MLIFFPTIKKLYPYYLKKITAWRFWIAVTLGLLWGVVRVILTHNKAPNGSSPPGIISVNFPAEGLTINDIFNQSLFFFLAVTVGVGGIFSSVVSVRELLAFTWISDGVWKVKKIRTGEDELVLTFATPIRRREMVLSKMLAFLTQQLIITFVFSTLPYLINPWNLQPNNLILLVKFLFFNGFLFPLIFSHFFASLFWWYEACGTFISIFFWSGLLWLQFSLADEKPNKDSDARSLTDGPDGQRKFFELAKKIISFFNGAKGQLSASVFFLLWGFFFSWLHIDDFEETQFS
jgi:hypothetical protein